MVLILLDMYAILINQESWNVSWPLHIKLNVNSYLLTYFKITASVVFYISVAYILLKRFNQKNTLELWSTWQPMKE